MWRGDDRHRSWVKVQSDSHRQGESDRRFKGDGGIALSATAITESAIVECGIPFRRAEARRESIDDRLGWIGMADDRR